MQKMMCVHRSMAILAVVVWGWGSASAIFASDKSVTVLPARGEVTCQDFAPKEVILSMQTGSPGKSGKLSGPDNPADPDTSEESVRYKIKKNGTHLSFHASTTPVDFAVVRSGQYAMVYMYPSGGTTIDRKLTVTAGKQEESRITAFSLCYGLGNTPELPTTTGSCTSSAVFDGIGIQCPKDGPRTLVCNFELDNPFFGMGKGFETCCVCNGDKLVECDPDIPSGEDGACTAPKTGAGTEVSTHIEFNNDPYYCITRGGKRKCYKY